MLISKLGRYHKIKAARFRVFPIVKAPLTNDIYWASLLTSQGFCKTFGLAHNLLALPHTDIALPSESVLVQRNETEKN